MKSEDEIEVIELDPEKGDSGSDDSSQFENEDSDADEDHDNGLPSQPISGADPPNHEAQTRLTDEGLPIQQYKSGKRIFLQRHVQMMALSRPQIRSRLLC